MHYTIVYYLPCLLFIMLLNFLATAPTVCLTEAVCTVILTMVWLLFYSSSAVHFAECSAVKFTARDFVQATAQAFL